MAVASPQPDHDVKLHLPIEEQLPNIQENAAESPIRSLNEEEAPPAVESKNMSKTNILRNLFFFQNETGEISATAAAEVKPST
jgi:hypothetical protein